MCSNLITSAIIFGMIFMVSCVNDIDDVNNAAKLAEPGVERGKNIELFYSEYGNVKVRVTAPTVTRFLTDNPYTELWHSL